MEAELIEHEEEEERKIIEKRLEDEFIGLEVEQDLIDQYDEKPSQDKEEDKTKIGSKKRDKKNRKKVDADDVKEYSATSTPTEPNATSQTTEILTTSQGLKPEKKKKTKRNKKEKADELVEAEMNTPNKESTKLRKSKTITSLDPKTSQQIQEDRPPSSQDSKKSIKTNPSSG